VVKKSTNDIFHEWLDAQVDDDGNVSGIAAASIGGYAATNITTAATTLVKTGAATLHTVSVNTLGTVASTTKIYDGTTAGGTLLATINSLTVTGTFTYDIACATGICVVTTGTVAPDVTVSYK
jgi:hypothetical protein